MSKKKALENPQTGEVYKRVCYEQQELFTKITKLQDFKASDKYKEVSPVQRELLNTQLMAMNLYNSVLISRIVEFQKD
jgi:hypothetical protein